MKSTIGRMIENPQSEIRNPKFGMKSTIGRKIGFAFLVVLILMGAMVGITFQGFDKVISSLDNMELEAVKRGASGNMRFSIAQLLMAGNGYIITEKDYYQREYDRLSTRVDDFYQQFVQLPLTEEEQQLVGEIKQGLDSIRAYSAAIFVIQHPRQSPKAWALMETMDYRFGQDVNRKTTQIFDGISRRIEEHRVQAAANKENASNLTYGVTFLAVVISLVVSYLTVQRIAKPIVTVTKAANGIANGDYSQRPVVKTHDEVAVLAKSFCRMAESIQQSQRALEESKRFTENIVATVPSGLLVIGGPARQSRSGGESDVISVNRSFCELFNLKRQQVVGQPVDAVLQTIGLSQECREAIAARRPFRNLECRCSTSGKGEMVLNLNLSGIRLAEEEALIVIEDITERKRAETELQQAHERYKNIFEEDLTGDFLSTPTGELLACNPAFLRIFRFSSIEEAMNLNFLSLFLNPEARQSLIQRLQKEKTLEYIELEMLRRDGTRAYIVANLVGRFSEEGELLQIQGYFFDDTKRRELEQQLIQAQKLESLGALAGGIAHDFNNILGIIMGHSTLMDHFKSDPEKLSQSIDAITKATQRGASLVKQLLTFARKTEALFESVNVNDIIGEINKLLQETFPRTIAISTSLQPELPSIIADGNQIHQVLLNLCVNAQDAMPKDGMLSISTSAIEGEPLSSRFPKATARQYVQIEVADTGIGMDEATRQRIFEPFFTTKGPGKGTGLGLSLVFGIMESHNGFIDVRSAPGEGTAFHLYFPVEPHTVELEQVKEEPAEAIPGGNETILVVEDEEMLRELVRTTLEAKGYRVLTAGDGEEAVETYRRHQGEIHLVLCDMGLPKFSGYEVYQKLKKLNPSIWMALASGYLEPGVKSEILKGGVKDFIQKPYSPSQMLRTIRSVLDLQ